MAITPQYVWRVVVRGTYQSTCQINHAFTLFQEVGAPSASPASIVVDVRDNWMNLSAVKVNWSPQLVWQVISCQQLAPDPTTDMASISVNIPGTGATANHYPHPAVCAVVTTWRTERPGRRGRGRTYWCGVHTLNTELGNVSLWASSVVAKADTLASNLFNHYTLGSNSMALQLGVWSRVLAGDGTPVPSVAVARVTSRTTQQYICTMGSRRYGHGI